MPADKRPRPTSRPVLAVPRVSDPDVAKAIDALSEAAKRADARATRVQLAADLVIGVNRLNHNLGRKPTGVALTPTAASAAFAWAMTASDADTVTITVVGADQPGAALEVY